MIARNTQRQGERERDLVSRQQEKLYFKNLSTNKCALIEHLIYKA